MMHNYRFHFKDGRVEDGEGFSGLNAWHTLGYSTYWWCVLSYVEELS